MCTNSHTYTHTQTHTEVEDKKVIHGTMSPTNNERLKRKMVAFISKSPNIQLTNNSAYTV